MNCKSNIFFRSATCLALLVAVQMSLSAPGALGEEDEYGIEHPTVTKKSSTSKDSSNEPDLEPEYTGTVTSIDAMKMGRSDGDSTAATLMMMAEYCQKNGNNERALKLIRLALEKDNNDIDYHKVYAEVLERKWNTDKKKDNDVYNACVQEWLIILRQEVGWEKLSTAGGLSIPGLGKLYEDEDQVIPAKQHLMSLTGVLPKVWENDKKYLKRVMKPSTTGVTGKILPKGEANKIDDAKSDTKSNRSKSGTDANSDAKTDPKSGAKTAPGAASKATSKQDLDQ